MIIKTQKIVFSPQMLVIKQEWLFNETFLNSEVILLNKVLLQMF